MIQRRYFLTFKDPRNRFQGMDSASLCSPVGRYDNPIPTRFLAPIDCSKFQQSTLYGDMRCELEGRERRDVPEFLCTGGMILYIIHEEEAMILCTRKDSVYERDDPVYEEEEVILHMRMKM